MRWQERDGPPQADGTVSSRATLVRRPPRREAPALGDDAPAVQPASVGGGPRLVTAIAESGLKWVHQFGGGPARGLYQIEPATLHEVVVRYRGR